MRKKREKKDKLYKINRANPFNVSDEVLFFIQRIRDESHRFVLSFHKKRRTKKSLFSAFDNVKGIGEKRKQMLIKHFKGISNIKEASVDEISALKGINHQMAEELKKNL